MVALVDGVPRTLGLRELIQHYVDHQREVVTRRTQYELRRAEARAHILEGLLVALDNLDAVIKLIRALDRPRRRPRGADRRVRALPRAGAGDPRHAPAAPHRARVRQGPRRARRPDRADRRAAGDPRRRVEDLRPGQGGAGSRSPPPTATSGAPSCIHFGGDVDIEDMIADQQMVISLTASGYVKRLPLATYRQQRRGGVGVMGMNMKEDDYIEHLHICSTHDFLLFFTNRGKVYRLKVYELPEGSRTAKGSALVNLLPLREGENGDGGDPDPRLQGEQVPRLRDRQGPDQEDRVPRLQHADQGGRDHRDQGPRRRRAGPGAPHLGQRRHPHGLPLRTRVALLGEAGAADGPRAPAASRA